MPIRFRITYTYRDYPGMTEVCECSSLVLRNQIIELLLKNRNNRIVSVEVINPAVIL